jgi:hypothetical protein
MKKALCVVALMALATSAFAVPRIDLYVSTDAAMSDMVFDRSEMDFSPFFDASANTPYAMGCMQGPVDQTFYVWGQFAGDTVDYSRIYAVELDVQFADTMAPCDPGLVNDLMMTDSAMYRHAILGGPPAGRWHRWDTAVGERAIGDLVTAVGTDGIQFYQPGDGSTDLYNELDGTFLLGAFHVTGNQGMIMLGLDTVGGMYADDGAGDTFIPEVYVNGTMVQAYNDDGAVLPTVSAPVAVAGFVPEPASLLLLGLAGLIIRRR